MDKIKEKMDEIFKQQDDNWGKYHKLLPDSEDIELIVLKGHLIIEEMLYSVAIKLTPYPKYIDSARLTFRQLCFVVRSLLRLPVMDKCWDAIASLNKLRNKFSHNLEPKNINIYINEIEKLCNYDGLLYKYVKPPQSEAEKAKSAICFIMGQLTAVTAIHEFLEHYRTLNFPKGSFNDLMKSE